MTPGDPGYLPDVYQWWVRRERTSLAPSQSLLTVSPSPPLLSPLPSYLDVILGQTWLKSALEEGRWGVGVGVALANSVSRQRKDSFGRQKRKGQLAPSQSLLAVSPLSSSFLPGRYLGSNLAKTALGEGGGQLWQRELEWKERTALAHRRERTSLVPSQSLLAVSPYLLSCSYLPGICLGSDLAKTAFGGWGQLW